MGKRHGTGGGTKGKISRPWRLRERGIVYAQISGWGTFTVHDTEIQFPATNFATGVLSKLRAKHTEILTEYFPEDFIRDARFYLRHIRVQARGTHRVNIPGAALPDEEAFIY